MAEGGEHDDWGGGGENADQQNADQQNADQQNPDKPEQKKPPQEDEAKKAHRKRIKAIRERARKRRELRQAQQEKDLDDLLARFSNNLNLGVKKKKKRQKKQQQQSSEGEEGEGEKPDNPGEEEEHHDEAGDDVPDIPEFFERRDGDKGFESDSTIRSTGTIRSKYKAPRQIKPGEKPILKPSTLEQGTITGFKRVELSTPQQDQLNQKEMMVDSQTNAIAQQQILIELIDSVKPQVQAPDEQQKKQQKQIDELITVMKYTMSTQAAMLNKTQKEIEQSKQLATYYSPSLKVPPIYEYTDYNIPGTRELLQAKNVKAAIDSFNPDKNPNQDFGDTWKQVLLYTNGYKLDSKAYTGILNILVQGSASQDLYELSINNCDIIEVLTTMGDLYSKRRTIVDDMTDLNNFKRKPNEHIRTAMQRAKTMAERVKHLWPTIIWEETKRREILMSIMRQIVSEQTRRHLDHEEMKHWKAGLTIEYNALLDIVETYEHTKSQTPSIEKNLTINVCNGTPKSLTDNFRENTYQYTDEIKPTNNRKMRNLMSNVARINRTLGISSVEPMDIGYKPTVTFPPTSTNKPAAEAFQKKRRLGTDGQYEAIKLKPENTQRTFTKLPRHLPRSEQQKTATTSTSKDSYPKKTDKGPALLNPPKDNQTQSKQGTLNYHEEKLQGKYPFYNKDYNKTYTNNYNRGGYNNYNNRGYRYNGYKKPSYGYNYRKRGYGYNNNRGYRRGYNNYRGYNNRYKYNGNYKYEAKEKTPKDFTCPGCKTTHKISNFCPNTGAQVIDKNQLALNYQGSQQGLPMRTLH